MNRNRIVFLMLSPALIGIFAGALYIALPDSRPLLPSGELDSIALLFRGALVLIGAFGLDILISLLRSLRNGSPPIIRRSGLKRSGIKRSPAYKIPGASSEARILSARVKKDQSNPHADPLLFCELEVASTHPSQITRRLRLPTGSRIFAIDQGSKYRVRFPVPLQGGADYVQGIAESLGYKGKIL